MTDAIDFVIVNIQFHDEYDDFKKVEIEPDVNYLQMNHLLQHYCHIKPYLQAFGIFKYGKTYLKLTSALVDCDWIYKVTGQQRRQQGIYNGMYTDTDIDDNL